MIVLAHLGGVPLEELIPSAAGAGIALLLARTWLRLRLSRGEGRRSIRAP